MDELKEQYMTTQFIVVRYGDEQFGIDIKYVDNIVRMQRITRVPKVQSYIKGCDQPAWRDHSGHQPAAENGTFR